MRNCNKINKALLANTYEVEMNLIEDWDNLLNDRMIKMGYKSKAGGYSSLDYHKAMKKLISIRPRKVFYSQEFICPDECFNSLNKLVSDIKNGENLLAYMSKQVINPASNDGMLNDWGIHHFHLNNEIDKVTGFVKRSDWLLLAYVNENAVFLLNVYPHNKQYLWTHIKLVEIIHNNWPELIENNKLNGAVELSEKLDDNSYSKLRKANVSTFVEIGENKVYGLIGGGYASDGSSIEAVRTSDYWYSYIKKVEYFIRDEYLSLKCQMLAFDSISEEKKLELKLLTFTEDEMILIEKQRNVIIKVNYQSGNIRMCKLINLLDKL